MDSLKNISQFNTGSTIANGMELSESAIISYQTAIDGLSLSQAQAALSSTALTDAQKEQILISAGLLQSTQAITLEEIKQMASSASLSAQKKEEILTTLQGAYSENEWNMERLEAIAASGGEAGAIAQSILAKKTENAENIKGVASNKALTASLWEQLKARLALLAANPVAWIAGVAAVSVGLIALQKKFTKSLDECTEELSNFNSEVENAQSEADSLQTEWETCQKRLGELQKLADNGTISIIEQEEYERLLKTNDELERNIRIQKEKAQLSAIDAANSADETLSKTVESKYVTVNTQDSQGVEVTQTAWITPKEELNASIEEYKRLQTEIDRLKVSYDKGNISAEEYNTQLTDLTNQQTDARNRASEMSDILVESEQAYTNLTNTGAELTTTQTANYNSVKQANAAYNDFLGTINGVDSAFENLDTTEKAQSLKNKYAAKKVSLPNGQGTYTVEDKEISDWIDTLPDEDLTVLASINFSGEQTKDSMQEALDYAKNNVDGNIDETDILSFSDAWEQLKNSAEDATKGLADDLIELAESGKLTAEALSEADTTDFFKNAGISAEEAVKKINQLVSASTQLQSMSAQISKMSDMLADKKNGTVASASDLAGFDATVKGLESWAEFERVMGSSKSSMEECQAAANALATEWVNNSNFLENLTEENKQYYVTQLDNMGVENANEVVTATLAQKKKELAAQTEYETLATEYNSDAKNRNNQITTDLTNATIDEIAEIIAENNATTDTTQVMAEFALSKIDVNNAQIDTSSDIEQIVAIANAAGASAEYVDALRVALNNLQKAEQGKKQVSELPLAGISAQIANARAEANVKSNQDIVQSYIDDIQKQIKEKRLAPSDYIIKPSGSSGHTAPKSKSGSGSNSKQTIDWIERKLDVLQKKIDATKAKFENLFTLKDKKNNLNEQIKLTNSLLNTTNKAAERYKKAANGVKLSDSLKKKVQNGSYDITEYGDKTAQNIQKYQNYIDKYNELIKQADTLNTDIRNLKSERYQLYIDDADARTNRYETLMDGTASTGKRISYLKKSKKTISTSYKNKIKQAINDGNYVEASTLRAEWKNALKDNTISQYQERADKADKKAAKSQALAALDEGNYKKQNKHLESQKKSLRESYNWQIKIAKKKGDTLEVARLQAEKEKELRDLTKEEFDNIVNTYDNQVGLNNNKIKAFQDQISLLEAKGQQVGSALYTKQMTLNNLNEKKLVAEREKLIKKLNEIPKGTDDWYAAQDTLFSVESDLVNIQIENANLQKSINQLKFDRFDDLLDKLNDIVDETNFLKDMLSDNLFDDNGMITDDGVTAMGLTAQNYDVYLAQAEKYKQMLSDITEMYDEGKISLEEYEEYQRTYSQGQRDAIKSAKDCKDAINDLVKQGLDAQISSLEEAVSKQKELLNAQKESRDFSRKMLDLDKEIARTERQLQILSGDDSESNRKTIRELKSKLENLKQDRDDTIYDKSIEQQQDALDDLVSASKEKTEEYLKDANKVFIDALDYVNAHTTQISSNLEKISSDLGYDISTNITDAWKDGGKAVDSYENILKGNVPKVTAQIGLITSAWKEAALAAEQAAEAMVKATTSEYQKHTGSGAGGSGKTTNPKEDEYNNYQLQKQIGNYLLDNTKDAKGDHKSYSSLNQYIYEKTGKILPEDKQAGLAKILGVKGVGKDTTADDRSKILKALKDAKFSSGDVIDAKNLLRQTGEDGIALVKHEEAVLTKPQWQSIRDLGIALTNMNRQIYKPYIPEFQTRNTQSPVYNIDNSITVEGVATDKIVQDMENMATKQAEKVVSKINNMAYAKGVRRK